ncbi:AEC family transporter [Phaeobacter inhibens]|uniref:Putative membrane transport protein n=1 Tax=Phaeobacter inhibens TaxID=221822 RepID=A0A2I7GGW7_9RHOB|nr:AEC family transporter [Phaeobacter inhibens]AUQ52828.1 putative membrane transport protein [Phaeobacter inhibens]AUQ76843.1 putative membrane transport protein [Phaeobacter inhibens]AUQ97526.1 putative membrane transport protein [Phaeobacter inhibens]AUR14004.1 putative membrane transport protein [Phaeobacter inhibens]UWR45305.1 AEC family transporter [Phaeobacter inhibens]
MLDIFLRTLPFFAIIGLGYWAGRSRFFSEQATASLTKFVFYFPLSAMIFRFAANLSFSEIFDIRLILGYLLGTMAVYILTTAVALLRRLDMQTAAVEAQCAAIGNVGFLGLPMMVLLFGPASVGPMMLILSVDLVVFSSLIVVLINVGRGSGFGGDTLRLVGRGLLQNPMILSICAGLIWSALALPIPTPANAFLSLLGDAATPGALFAIGASLASKSAERVQIASWLSFAKLVLHPAAVALCLLLLIPVDPYAAAVAIAAAALPVAGNVYMLAQHYGVAPHRASAAILLSTTLSILTLPMVIAWVSEMTLP